MMSARFVNVKCPRCAAPLSLMWQSPLRLGLIEPWRLFAPHDPNHAAKCGILVVFDVLAKIDEYAQLNASAPPNLIERVVVNGARSWDEAEKLAGELDAAKKEPVQ